MKFKLIKVDRLSGSCCSIYSIVVNDESETLIDKFILENINSFKSETKELISRLVTIGKKTGAREQYFKENEGIPGDGVCALFDEEKSNLRLYCIRYGTQLIVVGSGGIKPKSIRSFQDDEKLTDENYLLRRVSRQITERIKAGEIKYTCDFLEFMGDLEFDEF